jgi:hypothetical protein
MIANVDEKKLNISKKKITGRDKRHNIPSMEEIHRKMVYLESDSII